MKRPAKKHSKFVEGKGEGVIPSQEEQGVAPRMSLEEQWSMLWVQYKKPMMICVLALCVGFVGVQGMRWYEGKQVEKLQAEFSQAKTMEERVQFAKRHDSRRLGGMVYLELGDGAYDEGQFEQSGQYYEAACKGLAKTPFFGRALLGAAISHVNNNQVEIGKEKLKALLQVSEVSDMIKAQAAYTLALIHQERAEYKECEQYLDLIANMPFNGVWGQKALM